MAKDTRLAFIPDEDPVLVFGVEYVDVINIWQTFKEAEADLDSAIEQDDHAVLIYGFQFNDGSIAWRNEVNG